MTTDQLTQDVMELKEHQFKNDTKIDNVMEIIKELKEDVKSTKNLAEDVHIMAVNISNMQKTLEVTNKKVDTLAEKDFKNYQENKKILKDRILSALGGAIGTGLIGLIVWLVQNFAK